MESLAETLPLFTDTQLNFLSELEQLCLENDSVSCVDKVPFYAHRLIDLELIKINRFFLFSTYEKG